MKTLLKLEDDQYPLEYIDHTRYIARAILLNDKNKVALIKVNGDDMFGHRDYYETPGGGMKDNETAEQACYREVQEETGYDSIILEEIGIVEDYYNLIHRKNINHYFLTRATHFVGKHLDNYETKMLEKVIWVDINEAIRLYQNMGGSGVAILVKNRELPILMKVKEILERSAL